ncbi:MAG: 50S ribosomal protein L6 [Ignavibacteria bacterium]|nr:50S ribosomal protein L6 [Ignavibacteria bacterium]
MSRIGKKPVIITDKVKINQKDRNLEVSGPNGSLKLDLKEGINVNITGNEILLTRENETKKVRALHGLYRSLLQNMVTGVSEGFSKKLELVGIGYRAEIKDKNLVLMLGFSHPTIFCPPDDIKLEVPNPNTIIIKGANKELVGLVAAKIRSFRQPEPYKGKGIKYENEYIRRKAGKTAAK